VYITLSETVKK